MRKYIFLSFFLVVFWHYFLIDTATIVYADVLTTWQNTCDDWHGKPITFVSRGFTYPNYCLTDENGYKYWQDNTDLDYTPTSTLSTINISNTWHLWAVSKINAVPGVLYFDYQNHPYFLTGGATTTTITIPNNGTAYLLKYDNFLYTPIKQVNISAIYGNGYPSFYFLVYTDVDLSYINSSDTLYYYLNYLSNFNSIYASSTPEQGLTLPAGTCDDLGTFAGALCRVITYLFYPSQSSLTQFSNLKDMISTKPPFGYWTSVKGYLNTLSSTSTPAFTLTAEIGNITFFATLKTGLIWILWIFFGFWVIKRIARFDF